MATYAIGDIQGCLDELQSLLEKINFSSDDQLWFAGDIVNRGPKSLETLRFVKNLGAQAVTILGNHDLHLLAVVHSDKNPTPKDTLDEVLYSDDRDELLHWLRQQPLLHHDADLNFTMTHAGIPPNWTLAEARGYANEVEQVLRSDAYPSYFAAMYGNSPARWKDSLEGQDRLRCITNYFTRMRFCDARGKLDFGNKSATSQGKFKPWFSHPDRLTKDDPIVFGHWASLEGKVNVRNVYAIDTGCVWGGELTALRLDDLSYFSVNSRGYF